MAPARMAFASIHGVILTSLRTASRVAAVLAVLAWLAVLPRAAAQNTTSANNAMAAGLNGSGSFTIESLPALDGAFTFEAWVRPTTHGSYWRILDIGPNTTDNLLLTTIGTTGRPVFVVNRNGAAALWLEAPATLVLERWTHVAAVLGSDRSARLYIDGQLAASGTSSSLGVSTASTSNFIGKSRYPQDSLFNGAVTDVRIWSTARTLEQIQENMPVGSISGATTGLVAAYPFGSTGASVLADVSGNNRTLSTSGSVSFNVPGPFSPTPSPAMASANNAMTAGLAGSGWYAIPALPAMGGTVTLEGWVFPRSHASFAKLIDLGNGAGSDNLVLLASSGTSGKPRFTIFTGTANSIFLETTNAIPLNAWTHLAAVINSDRTAQIFVNGQLAASGTASSLPSNVARSSNFIGKSNWSQDPVLDATVADVRIWSTARTQDQIQATMPVGSISGATTGLVAAYPFGSTGASVLADVSGNSRTLTQSANVEYAKVGTGSLTAQGLPGTSSLNVFAGSLTFNTTQTYTGGTVIDGGSLLLAVSGTGVGVIRGAVTVRSQGKFLLQGVNALGWQSGTRVSAITIDGGLVETTASGDQGWGVAYRLNGGELRSNGGVGSSSATSYYSMGGGTTVATLANANPSLITGRIIMRDGNPNDWLDFNVADGSAAIDLLVSASITPQNTTGWLTKNGAGTMVFTGQNTYAGGTIISDGTIQVGNGGTTGDLGTGQVINNARVVFNRSDNLTFANAISGTGSVTKDGAGTLTLPSVWSHTGGTVVSAGTLAITRGGEVGALRGVVTVGPGAVLSLREPNALGYIDGAQVTVLNVNGGLVETTAPYQFFRNAHRLTAGEIRANGGTSSSSAASWYWLDKDSSVTSMASPSPSVISGRGMFSSAGAAVPFVVADGEAAVDLLVSAALTEWTANQGSGLTKSGAGTMVVSGQNTYSGVTTISAGTLQVGDGGTTGTLGTGNVVNNATLAFNRSGTATFGNVISGSGTLVKRGSGTVALSGANTYSGATTVSEGTLALSGSGSLGSSSTITVVAGAQLDTTGRTSTLALGSAQALANSGGNASLTGNLNAEAGTLSLTADGATPALTVSGGTLSLGAGTVVRLVKAGTALAAGSYKVVSKGSGGAVSGVAPSAVQVDGAGMAAGMAATAEISGGELFVKVAAPQMASSGGNSIMVAGLNQAGWYRPPWLASLGSAVTLEAWVNPRSHVMGQRAIELGNTPDNDTVMLRMSEDTSGQPSVYVQSGGTWVGSAVSPVALPLNTWTHLAGVVASDRSMQLYVNGQLMATGTASVVIPSVARSANFVGNSRNNIPLDGSLADVRIWSVARTQGQIQAAMPVGSITGTATGLVAAYPFGATGSGVLADVSGNSRNLAQSGTVGYQKLGEGTVATTLSALGSFRYYRFAPTALRGGTSADAVQLAEFQMLFNGNRLAGATASNPGGGVQPGQTAQQANDNSLSTKWYDGTKTTPLVLDFGSPTLATAYRFATAEDMPTRDPVSWRVEGSLDNASWVVLDTRTNYAVSTSRNVYLDAVPLTSSALSSGLAVTAGKLNLSGANLFTGGTVVNGGSLSLTGSISNHVNGSFTVSSGGLISVDQHDVIGGGGGHTGTPLNPIVVQAGGTFRNGIHSATGGGFYNILGPVTLSGGTLLSLGSNPVAGTPGFSFSFKGQVTVNGGATTSTLDGPGFTLGAAAVTGITFDVADGSAAVDLNVPGILGDGPNTAFTAVQASSLVKSGDGVMVLSGNNTYSGGTTVGAGTLQVGNGGTSGSLGSGNVVNNATLVLNRSNGLTVSNLISGTGSLQKQGSGTATLTGANSYSGATFVGTGTLALSGSGSLGGSGSITVADGATLDVTGRSSALALTSSQSLANQGGGGTLMGNINASSGTLALVSSDSAAPLTVASGTFTVAAGTSLRVNRTGSAMVPGTYKLIARSGAGQVSGVAPSSVVVEGAGVASGFAAGVQVAGGELLLVVATPITVTLGGLEQSYDGTPRAATVTTQPAGIATVVTYNGSATVPVHAGSYAVVARSADIQYSGSVSGTLVVSKAPGTIQLGDLSQTFDGTARTVVATTVPPGLSWSATYNGSINAPTNVGIYAVVAAITDTNYTGTTSGVLTVRSAAPGTRVPATPNPPSYINHQGFLSDASGNPLGSPNPRNYDLVFRIYAQATGGTALWAERQSATLDQGKYSVMLGEGANIGAEPWPLLHNVLGLGDGTERHLEVTVRGIGLGGTDVTMTPRFRLLSLPYAFLARHARTADTLVGSNGVALVRVSGSSVGVNVEQPNAGLDVGGTLTVNTVATPGNATVDGILTAAAFAGNGTIPMGGIVAWAGTVPPQGWALCDGQTVEGRRTPDLRGRFVLGQGAGAGLTPRTIGQVGGSETHVLGLQHLTSHTHVFDPVSSQTSAAGAHQHGHPSHAVGYGIAPSRIGGRHGIRTGTHFGWETLEDYTSHTHRVQISATSSTLGGGQSHPGMPPYYVLAYIMRVQ